MNNPPQDSAGQSQLDILIAEYLSHVDDSVEVDVDEFLKPHPDLAEEFHAYLRNAKLADVIADKESQANPQASQDTTPSLAVDETLAPRPNRPEYAVDQTLASGPAAASDPEEPLPRKFGHYELQRLLGRGAMGSVYLAKDSRLKRRIALKIPRFASGTEPDGALERFAREARAAAAIEHPNICPVYEVGEHDGKSFIAMAFITGKTLGELVRGTQGLNPMVAIGFVRKIALALAEAHDRGIIHRDLKPGNLMVNQRNEPIVMDFGLAREIHNEGEEKLTQDGTIIGTPTYMSPEQVDGVQSKVGAASDIYSLGVVFYELLTGTVPFTGTILSIMHQIASKEPSRPASVRTDLSPAIEAVCLKMMHKQPTQRYASMHEVAATLAGLLRDDQTLKDAPSQPEPTALAAGSSPITAEQLQAQTDQVHAFIKASNWPEAERLLVQMEANESPVAANYAKWATEQLVTVRATLEKKRIEANAAFQQAQSRMKRHDYVGAMELLSKVPASVRTPAISALLEKAVATQTQIDALFKQIQRNLKTRQLGGTLQHLQQLLELKPNDLVAQYLFRKYKWQSRFGLPAGLLADAFAPAESHVTRPTYEEPFLRKWIGIAAHVFATFTIGTAAAVTIYIKQNGKQKVAVRVTDEAMAEGDVEVVVDASDGDSTALASDATEMTESPEDRRVQRSNSTWIKLIDDELSKWSTFYRSPDFRGGAVSQETIKRNPFSVFGDTLTLDPHMLPGQKLIHGYLYSKERFGRYRLRFDFRFIGDAVENSPSWGRHQCTFRIHAEPVSTFALGQINPNGVRVSSFGSIELSGTSAIHEKKRYTDERIPGNRIGLLLRDWNRFEVEVQGSELLKVKINEAVVNRCEDITTLGSIVSRTQGPDDQSSHVGENLANGHIVLNLGFRPWQIRGLEIQPLHNGTSISDQDKSTVKVLNDLVSDTVDMHFVKARPLSELNKGTKQNAYAWLSPDGKTIWWTRAGGDRDSDMGIFQATRSSKMDSFTEVRRVCEGRCATVSPDGLEIVTLFDADGDWKPRELGVSRRDGRGTSFHKPQRLTAVDGIADIKSAAFGPHGLTMLVWSQRHPASRISQYERATAKQDWELISELSIPKPASVTLWTWPFIDASGDHLFLASKGQEKYFEFPYVASRHPGDSWDKAVAARILIDGKHQPLRAPKFCAATGELFYSVATGPPNEPYQAIELWIADLEQPVE